MEKQIFIFSLIRFPSSARRPIRPETRLRLRPWRQSRAESPHRGVNQSPPPLVWFSSSQEDRAWKYYLLSSRRDFSQVWNFSREARPSLARARYRPWNQFILIIDRVLCCGHECVKWGRWLGHPEQQDNDTSSIRHETEENLPESTETQVKSHSLDQKKSYRNIQDPFGSYLQEIFPLKDYLQNIYKQECSKK